MNMWIYSYALTVITIMAAFSHQRAFMRCATVQAVNWLLGVTWIAATGLTDPWAFNIVIDGIAAAIVLTRPAAKLQSILGSTFLIQIAVHCGYGFNALNGEGDPLTYYWILSAIGWVQMLVLGVWGGWDVGNYYLHRYRHRHPLAAHAQGNSRLDTAG